jgi:hypothetical protein
VISLDAGIDLAVSYVADGGTVVAVRLQVFRLDHTGVPTEEVAVELRDGVSHGVVFRQGAFEIVAMETPTGLADFRAQPALDRDGLATYLVDHGFVIFASWADAG